MDKEMKQAQETLDNFSTSFKTVEEAIQPLMSTLRTLRSLPSDEEVNDKMDALSRSRLHITLCYTINCLFSMYLRTQGVDPSKHPVSEEIVRVQDAFLRLRKVEAGQSDKEKLSKYEKKVQERKRNVRDAMALLKEQQFKLSRTVFPQEADLYNALTNQSNFTQKFENEQEEGEEEDSEREKEGDDSENEGEEENSKQIVETPSTKESHKKKKKKKSESTDETKTKKSTSKSTEKKKKKRKLNKDDDDKTTSEKKKKKRKKAQ